MTLKKSTPVESSFQRDLSQMCISKNMGLITCGNMISHLDGGFCTRSKPMMLSSLPLFLNGCHIRNTNGDSTIDVYGNSVVFFRQIYNQRNIPYFSFFFSLVLPVN